MINSYMDSLGGLVFATGPMVPAAIDGGKMVNVHASPAPPMTVPHAEIAFTCTSRADNFLTHIEFKCTIAKDDDPSAPAVSTIRPCRNC